MEKRFTLLLFLAFLFTQAQGQPPSIGAFSSLNGITATLGENGETQISPDAFILSQQSCCPDGFEFSFLGQGGVLLPTITFTCADLGNNVVTIYGEDCLGQFNVAEAIVLVQDNVDICNCTTDCCIPEMRLAFGLTLTLNDQGQVTIPVDNFNRGSFSNCGGDLELSFSPTPGDLFRSFDCDDLGFQVLPVWAFDDSGNASFALPFVLIQDNFGLCPDPFPGLCLPTPVTYAGISMNIPPSGVPISLNAADFDAGCYLDFCAGGGPYALSFSTDTSQVNSSYFCAQIGTQIADVWITGPNGMQNYSENPVIITDYFGLCDGASPAASNDQICDAIPLDAAIGNCLQTYWNTGATAESNEPVPFEGDCGSQNAWCAGAASVENSVWFTFTAPTSGSIAIETTGFDTQIAVWEADSCDDLLNGNFNMVGANDDSANDTTGASFLTLECLIPGQVYWLQVDGSGGDAGNFLLGISDPGITCDGLNPLEAQNCGDLAILPFSTQGKGEWIHLYSNDQKVLLSVNDLGAALPELSTDLQIHKGEIRTDAAGTPYLDRNWEISPATPVASEFLLRLYFTSEELDALLAASDDPITFEDLLSTKVSEGLCGDYAGGGSQVIPEKFFTINGQTLGLQLRLTDLSAFYLHGFSTLTSTEASSQGDWSFFPNPVSQQLTLQVPSMEEDGQLFLFDSSGRILRQQEIQRGTEQFELSLSTLPPGLYWLKLHAKDTTRIGKFVKE